MHLVHASDVARRAGGLAACDALLTPTERARCDRILRDAPRDEARVSRALCRTVLGRLLGVPPGAIALTVGPHGRPHMADAPARPLDFNVSHSEGLVACAVSGSTLGVDVEDTTRLVELDPVAAISFSRDELVGYRALSGDARRERFFALWTAKEAYLKARGVGLGELPLDGFSVRFDEGARPCGFDFAPGFGDDGATWALVSRGPRDGEPALRGAAFALALRVPCTTPVRVRFFAEDPDALGS